ncbi:Ifi27l2 [Columba guinea]|nr:Ifi27l2 [Columba guinea]
MPEDLHFWGFFKFGIVDGCLAAGPSLSAIVKDGRVAFRKLMALAKSLTMENIARMTIGAALGAGLLLVGSPMAIGALGFTSAGIAAGSVAAKMMSAAAIANGGGVAAGSSVAVLQSIELQICLSNECIEPNKGALQVGLLFVVVGVRLLPTYPSSALEFTVAQEQTSYRQ